MKGKVQVLLKADAWLKKYTIHAAPIEKTLEARNMLFSLCDGIWQNGHAHGYTEGYKAGVEYIVGREMKVARRKCGVKIITNSHNDSFLE